MATTKKAKKATYFNSLTWKTKDGKSVSMATQLYQVGLYLAITVDGQLAQLNINPFSFARKQRSTIKELEKDGIKYSTGRTITVTEDEKGFYKEVN